MTLLLLHVSVIQLLDTSPHLYAVKLQHLYLQNMLIIASILEIIQNV